MKIVFYNETLMSGGIEKCIELLCEYLAQKYEIEIVYVDETKLDNNIVTILSKNAYVHKLNVLEKINADICIWCRLNMNYEFLKNYIITKKNFLWIHSKYDSSNKTILDNEEFVKSLDEIICVSETVKKTIPNKFKPIVIHNFISPDIIKLSNEIIDEEIFDDSKLKFITVSRISNGKGFERMYDFVCSLKKNNIEFEYIIIGKGRKKEEEYKNLFKDISEVKFLGYRDNPYAYIKKADYLVQLSDYETWGNVITEAKILKTPVVITNFESSYEQIIDNFNGVIVDLNTKDYTKYMKRIINNKKIYKDNLNSFVYNNEIQKWLEIIKK